ncbi:Spo0B domain-containing protein [Bacillus kwashiorkori]|uniref:Spo0B domain-containing protein n=1 Tax=Bacillus kwashiorkori TaxID=1522318 RepID=UPI000780E906|nr:Spo0B C-terminal domain-containing protein [Bacillus kwashiorkori]
MKEWNTVDILRHSRHDWLNKIQLIKGYMSIGNLQRVEEIIDKIVQDSEMEARVSNINAPKFATLVLTYNWNSNPIGLTYTVTGDKKLTEEMDSKISEIFFHFTTILHKVVSFEGENWLHLQIETTNRFCLSFHFTGMITDVSKVQEFITKEDNDYSFTVQLLEENGFHVILTMKHTDSSYG